MPESWWGPVLNLETEVHDPSGGACAHTMRYESGSLPIEGLGSLAAFDANVGAADDVYRLDTPTNPDQSE